MKFALAVLLIPLAARADTGDGPSEARAHFGKGMQLAQAEAYGSAAGEFEEALRQDPRFAEAREQLGICDFQLRRYDAARAIFSEMLPSDKSRLATYYLARIDLIEHSLPGSIAKLRSLMAPEPFQGASYFLGVAYFKSGQYELAVTMLAQAIGENPRDFRAHQFLARAYQALGRQADAEREFRETRRLHTYYTDGSVVIGNCRALIAAGKRDEAIQNCVPLLETDDVDKLAMLGMVFGTAGLDEQAHAAWSRALALDPDSPELAYNLAFSSFRLHNTADAQRYAAEAVRLRPGFPEANALYGTVLYMLGKDEEALKVLTRAHELLPDDEAVTRLLAKEREIAAHNQ